MNGTISNILGSLAIVLLLAGVVLMFFMVEKQASLFAERRCRCVCAETAVPPVAPAGRVFYEGAVKGGNR